MIDTQFRGKFDFFIFNGENTLFTTSAQKWSIFRKKYFFSITGGGQDPIWNFPLLILFFFEPFPKKRFFRTPCKFYVYFFEARIYKRM